MFIDFTVMEHMPTKSWYRDVDGIYRFEDGRVGVWSDVLQCVVMLSSP